MHFIYAFILPI